MKIQYCSDLHLEFSANSIHLKLNPLEVVGDILLLADDIGYLSVDGSYPHPFWDWASKSYKQVIVVLGNHELYKGNYRNGASRYSRANLEKLRD